MSCYCGRRTCIKCMGPMSTEERASFYERLREEAQPNPYKPTSRITVAPVYAKDMRVTALRPEEV